MEWTAGAVSRRRDAVFLGFGHMLAAQLPQPTGRLRGALKVKTAGVEDRFQRYLAHDHWNNLRLAVETLQNCRQFFPFVAADQIDLADQDHVGKLDLFNQQIGDRALVFFPEVSPLVERFSAAW